MDYIDSFPMNPTLDSQKQKVKQLIEEMLNAGSTFCTINEKLLPDTERLVRKAGYCVTDGWTINDSRCTHIERYPFASEK